MSFNMQPLNSQVCIAILVKEWVTGRGFEDRAEVLSPG